MGVTIIRHAERQTQPAGLIKGLISPQKLSVKELAEGEVHCSHVSQSWASFKISRGGWSGCRENTFLYGLLSPVVPPVCWVGGVEERGWGQGMFRGKVR